MIEEAANHLTNNVRNDSLPPLDLIAPFDLTVLSPNSAEPLPRSLRVAVWNCRGGLELKLNEIQLLFRLSNCDILVLNETFRRPGTRWPSYFPPLLGESTDHASSPTRCPAGVAIVANPLRIRNIKSFSAVDHPASDGTKVCIKVNNIVILAVYIPPSSPNLLAEYVAQAHRLSSERESVIFCGDMNAHSRQYGAVIQNLAGTHIDTLTLPRGSSSFFRANTGPAFTRPSLSGQGGSVIDFIFGANADLTEGRCYDFVDWTSDHRPISCCVVPQAPRNADSTSYFRFRMENLEDPDTRAQYVSAIQTVKPALENRIRNMALRASPSDPVNAKLALVDAMELDFTSTVLNVAKSIIGTKRVTLLPLGPPPSASPEYSQAFNELQTVYRSLRSNPTTPEHFLTERDRLKIKVRAIAMRDKTRAYKDWLQNTGSLPIHQVMKIVRRIRRSKAAAGDSLATTPIALDSYRDHFAAQFQNRFDILPFTDALTSAPSLALAQQIFPKEYIASCVSLSRYGKAPGITGLTADLLRPVAISLSSTLELMFTTFFILAVVPRSWTRALVCPVPKKGDLTLISNYRPISLTETGRKLYELCLLKHLQPLSPLSREQGGFRTARSTIDQVDSLDKLIRESKRQHRRHPELAFLDIKAAYDSVPRGELWRRCSALGYPSDIINCLRSLFDHNSAQLVIKQKRSKPLGQPAGVLQGSVLSPLLYSVYIDPLVEALRSGPMIQLEDNRSINCLLYADDIVLIAKDPSALRQLLSLAEIDSVNRGYRFSPSKCVLISRLKHPQHLYGQPMTLADHFNYLGVEFRCSGIDETLHVANRISKLQKQADVLASIGARYLGFPRACSIRLFKAFLRPGLEYGITLMRRTKASIVSLEQAQKQALCKILGIHKNSHNVTTLAMSCCPPMIVRRACLDLNRQARIFSIFTSPDRLNHSLQFISAGILEPPPVPPSTTRAELIEDLHLSPLRVAVGSRFQSTLSPAGLEIPFAPEIPWSESRMLVLWLLRKFDCFNASRLCQVCSLPIRNQLHVSSCGNIPQALLLDPRIQPLIPEGANITSLPVESIIGFAELLAQSSYRPTVKALSEAILSAVSSVFGVGNMRI